MNETCLFLGGPHDGERHDVRLLTQLTEGIAFPQEYYLRRYPLLEPPLYVPYGPDASEIATYIETRYTRHVIRGGSTEWLLYATEDIDDDTMIEMLLTHYSRRKQ